MVSTILDNGQSIKTTVDCYFLKYLYNANSSIMNTKLASTASSIGVIDRAFH